MTSIFSVYKGDNYFLAIFTLIGPREVCLVRYGNNLDGILVVKGARMGGNAGS